MKWVVRLREKFRRKAPTAVPLPPLSVESPALSLEFDSGETLNIHSRAYDLVDRLLQADAGEVQIEADLNGLWIGWRIGGKRVETERLPLQTSRQLLLELKKASSAIGPDSPRPQSGTFRLRWRDGREVDVRASVDRGLNGETISLFFLSSERAFEIELAKLGFEEDALKKFVTAVSARRGLIVISGPTGSGKSEATFAALRWLNRPGKNIMTIEAPIKYELSGATQLQVDERNNLTFPVLVAAALKHQPDVLMVSEIRDLETAELVLRAARSRLVFTAMHVNDSISVVSRLLNMGIDLSALADRLLLTTGQRLVRTICPGCRRELRLPGKALIKVGFDPAEADGLAVFKGNGCVKCRRSGYGGYTGLFEVLTITPQLRGLLQTKNGLMELRVQARKEGMKTLRKCGLTRVRQGITTIEELLMVTPPD